MVLTYMPHDYAKFVAGYVVNKEFRKSCAGNNTSGACAVLTDILNLNKMMTL